MPQTLPIAFWQDGRNEPAGYVWCRHVKRYIRWQFSRCEIPTFLEGFGFRDYNEVEYFLGEWLDLRKPVPLAFLDAIDTRPELLKSILEIDQKEFDQALTHPVAPKVFWVEDAAGVQSPRPLPFSIAEADSIKFIEAYLAPRSARLAYLHWPSLKTILFEAGRAAVTIEYRPRLRIEGGHYSFGNDGSSTPLFGLG